VPKYYFKQDEGVQRGRLSLMSDRFSTLLA